MSTLCVGQDFCEELTCAVCLDSWKEPIELSPCGHIFCRECAVGLKECPVCRKKIESSNQPNRTLVNMALQIPVKCMRCGWQGTREQGMRHECGSGSVQPPPFQPSTALDANKPNPPTNVAASPNPYHDFGGSNVGGDYEDLWTSGAPVQPPPQPPQPPQLPPSAEHPQVIEPTGPRPWTLYGLGQNEYDQIVSLFVFFDDDDSGSLDRNEVARLARWLNFANTPQDVQRIFDDMDADHSGSLSLAEFLTWLYHNKPNPQALYDLSPAQYNTIMMQFHTYDTNQDGSLEMNEFVNLVQRLGEVRDAGTARKLFEMVDRDRDGAISLHDFLLFRAGRL
ncbi:hypothetical protein ABB37_05697 [Leptomonas pyrrhocoris]|uniref:Uncharacterized protein n=1 Tax=Leptomonas pyrrhocoris TaxID=157538 RepID=A0A0M9FZA8_LEPPY|nr:hypothetical protein ABB37_05697 [Leptomonas pyrrhocoris]KPA79210.1 hypothetical protein ABB37_05697 [Leptomonas pyrrhocoris]|eukprot:XP_015657649.1 hypothetical protein ABB37_05697 [Leptomonas pyrrhocoris]